MGDQRQLFEEIARLRARHALLPRDSDEQHHLARRVGLGYFRYWKLSRENQYLDTALDWMRFAGSDGRSEIYLCLLERYRAIGNDSDVREAMLELRSDDRHSPYAWELLEYYVRDTHWWPLVIEQLVRQSIRVPGLTHPARKLRQNERSLEEQDEQTLRVFGSTGCEAAVALLDAAATSDRWERTRKMAHPDLDDGWLDSVLDLLVVGDGLISQRIVEAALVACELTRGVWLTQALAPHRGDAAQLREVRPDLAESFVQLSNRLDRDRSSIARNVDAESLDGLIAMIRKLPGLARFGMPPQPADLRECVPIGGVALVLLAGASGGWCLAVSRSAIDAIELPGLTSTAVDDVASLWSDAVNYLCVSRNAGAEYRRVQAVMAGVLAWLHVHVQSPIARELAQEFDRVWWVPTGRLTTLPVHSADTDAFSAWAEVWQAGATSDEAGAGDDTGGLRGTLRIRRTTPQSESETVRLDDIEDRYRALGSTVMAAGCGVPGNHESFPLPTSMSFAPTLTILGSLEASAAPTDIRCVVVDSSEFDAHEDLPAVAMEAQFVADSWPNSEWISGPRANPDAVLAGIDAANLIHVACHCIADASNPRDYYLQLAEGSVLKLSDLDYASIPGGLAVLSACDTASSDRSEERVSFATAMLLTGLTGSIGTLTPVIDGFANQLAVGVHEELIKQWAATAGLDPAVALALTVQRFRASHPTEPFVWAQWVHVGR